VPALQRMLDYTHNAIMELESALGIGTPVPKAAKVIRKPARKKAVN